MLKKILFFAVLFTALLPLLYAADFSTSSRIDWITGEYRITISYPLEDSQRALPALKDGAEREIAKELKYILLDQIKSIVLDSRTTIGEYIEKNPAVIKEIYNLAGKGMRTYSLLSEDLQKVKVEYVFALYPDIVELFLKHQYPAHINSLLEFYPSADFSGIVIYVKKGLPRFGKETRAPFTPSLFPRVYDGEMNLLVDKTRVRPEALKKWGLNGYRKDFDLTKITTRIGFTPLKISAKGLFGINNTDIIISTRDAAVILSRENNINLIKEGRIVIIYTP